MMLNKNTFAAAQRVLTQMEKSGAVLQLTHANGDQHWTLSTGGRVPASVAELVISSASVVPAGDGLFLEALPQTWCWWKEVAR